MKTKLTLRLEMDLIEKAKRHAEASGRSVSDLVAAFFGALDAPRDDVEITPRVKALSGLLKGTDASEEDYHRYLEEKYL